MKKVLFLFVNVSFLAAQPWVQISDFPGTKRDDGVAVACGNFMYAGSGLQEGWTPTRDFYALHQTALTWSKIQDMPQGTERQYACAFSDGVSFYVFGGDGGAPLNDLYRYSAPGNWSQLPSKPGAGLIGASCFVFGNKAYIFGGKFSHSGPVSNELWEYDLTQNAWTKKNDLPFAGRWRAAATVSGAYGYLLFGIDANESYRKEFYRFDPSNLSWTKLQDFTHTPSRSYGALHAATDKLVLFGGYDTLKKYYRDTWYYDLNAAAWHQGPDLPAAGRRGDMAASFNNKFVFTCGLAEGDQRLKETWITSIPLDMKETMLQTISLFPIPANHELNVTLYDDLPASVQVFDIAGRTLNAAFTQDERSLVIDVSGLGDGIYFLRIANREKVRTAKFLKD
jgi:N-acetylneuraminic acid mutarotase